MISTLAATTTVAFAATIATTNACADRPADAEYTSNGLHGYIASRAESVPSEFHYGAGFYATVWPLIAQPIANFQIGLPSTWILPDNSDNKTEPLCPPGTLPRDSWPERGPTYDTVFQTLEGGLGYWAGNRFHYGPPKFSMNGTTDCYTNEVASPGWSFFYSSRPLADDRLGIAQISNRLLIPPDGLPFSGAPNGELLGYAYMALPLTDARNAPQPTGELSWTLFLNAANFKGPLAYYIPECWSRISRDYPTVVGRGLDARAASGRVDGSMEINTVPEFIAKDERGVAWTKIPELRFPVDASGRTTLVRDVALYSKAALYDAVLAWRRGGEAPKGAFATAGTVRPKVATGRVGYRQNDKEIDGIHELATPTIFEDGAFGLQWKQPSADGFARFPQYFRDGGEKGDRRAAVAADEVPASLGLRDREFPRPNAKPAPYSAEPLAGAWAKPGPSAGPFTAKLVDGSTVTYHWYRFVDQPVFAQCGFSDAERAALQSLIERMHRAWPIDGEYLAPPRAGTLASFDSNLFVTPPKGMEVGFVPIVVRQEITAP
ncbi:MAG: hypothetical protein RIS45_1425 [Planctomycetota bacterium]